MTTSPIILDYERPTLRDRTEKFKRNLPAHARRYACSFFPILQWITRYNTAWMTQDLIAGMTVGMMLVPQGIAYAKIANLDAQYGLYASFVGSCLYCLFGTSKDISIGPITVVSLLVGRAITAVTTAHPDISGPEVGAYLCVVTGIISMLLGMVRLGILVDFIPAPAIAGYMTGSAITISLGQWGKLVGMKLDTQQAPFRVVSDFLSNLSGVGIDAAFGVPSLVALYGIKIISGKLAARYPKYKQPLFYFGIMRSSVVLIIGTFISFLANLNRTESPFKILKDVPAGFDAMGVPRMNMNILGEIADVLPSMIIIMVLEHVSVAKSFGRISDYVIDPNQEILAIGVTNLVGAFFGAYPGTGAFSRTAIMSRSGAKTPLSSAFSAGVVVLALYVLTPAFYYIPSALLAAVVIHAVTDLVSGPKYIKQLLGTSKLEFFVFAAAVLITFFDGVENGIYVAMALSLFIVMINLARPRIAVLARAPLDSSSSNIISSTKASAATPLFGAAQHYVYVDEKDPHFASTDRTEPMPAGIVVLRLSTALLYPNAGHVSETIVSTAKARTRKATAPAQDNDDQQQQEQQDKDVLWNQPTDGADRSYLPVLEAVVLDCTAVSRIDTTGLQTLVSARDLLDRYAGHAVEWHFTGLASQQVRNDLVLYGFGNLTADDLTLYDTSSVSRSTTLKNDDEEAAAAAAADSEKIQQQQAVHTTGDAAKPEAAATDDCHQHTIDMADIVHPYFMEDEPKFSQIIVDPHQNLPRDRYPCFHWDIDSAVRSICDRWSSRPRTPMLQS